MKQKFFLAVILSLALVAIAPAQTNLNAVRLVGWLAPFNTTNSGGGGGGSTNVITSYFTNEWNGPFASWDDVKTTYGAIGDGVTDDTLHLSNALANAGLNGHSPVVKFPPGTYLVETNTLKFVNRTGVRFVRATGQRPVIKGINILTKPEPNALTNRTMILADGVPLCSWEGFIFDGNGDKSLVLVSQSSEGPFDTTCQYIDCLFTNAGTALKLGDFGVGGSEVSFVRNKISNCSTGLAVRNFNTLDIWAEDCEIEHTANGITDDINGAGNFSAYQCLFHDNTNDADICNTSFVALRDCLSTNSGRFFLACDFSQVAGNLTLERNTIIDPKTLPCVYEGNQGALALIDNTFLTRTNGGAIVQAPLTNVLAFSMGNNFLLSNAESLGGQTITLDDQVVSRPSNSGTLILSALSTNVGRFVTNLWNGSTSADLQAAIYAVTNRTGSHPVVHLPVGTNNISATVIIPGGCDVQIEGDSLQWSVFFAGTNAIQMFSCPAPAVCAFRNCEIEGCINPKGSTGIVAVVSGGAFWSRRLNLSSDNDPLAQTHLLVTGCSNATLDFLDFQWGRGTNGIVVNASTAAVRMRGTATSNDQTNITVTAGANLCIDEQWYEGTDAADYLHASGGGTLSIQSFNAAVNAGVGFDGQSAIFSNWTGTALLQNGSIRDFINPTSGSGALWISDMTYNNMDSTNPLQTAIGVAHFNANGVRKITSNVTTPLPDYAAQSNSLIRAAMALVRSTKANQNPDPNAMVMESVRINNCSVSLIAK